MVTSRKRSTITTNPLVWALAIVLVMVAGGYTYSIVTRCQTSTFEAIKLMSISLGKCEAPSPPEADKIPQPPAQLPIQPTKVSRADMPCRWAWVYLGKYSHFKGEYLMPPAFRFSQPKGPASPFPKTGDRIIFTADKTLLVTGYANAKPDAKCAKILSPPWGYHPETSKKYEAGTLKRDTEVAVNQVTLMPEPAAEPTYVWALVGPEQ